MTPNLPAQAAGTCWICGAAADSDEHKHKRSDMVTRYGRSWPSEERPFVFRGDGRPSRIPGPNSGLTLYRDMLCQPCNNARTQRFDRAYERLSAWVLSNTSTLHDRAELDFTEIFGASWAEETANLLCYFAKSLGCSIANAGFAPPEGLRRLMTTGVTDTRPFRLTFVINQSWYRIDPSGRILGKSDLTYWPHADGDYGYSWIETLGYLEIYHWYNVVWEPFPYGGDVMHGPVQSVTLGQRDDGDPDSSPDEVEITPDGA